MYEAKYPKRTSVVMSYEQYEIIKKLSDERHVSIGAVIRECIDIALSHVKTSNKET